MIPRLVEPELRDVLEESRIAFLGGPRQSGKSTLARSVAESSWSARYLSLDDAASRAAAQADPEGFLDGVQRPVAIDEVQRVPDLLLAIKSVVDREDRPGQFLLTGSADILLVPHVSDTLAGRMQLLELWPLAQCELKGGRGDLIDRLFSDEVRGTRYEPMSRQAALEAILAGGFPEVQTRPSPRSRMRWFRSYEETIVQRELPSLARIQMLQEVPRLLRLLANRVGGLLNQAGVASDLQMSADTVGRYLALLLAIYVIRLVPPWLPSLRSRPIKAPKVYFADTGLAAHVLGIDAGRLATDPGVLGALMENFVGMELVKQLTWSQVDATLNHWRSAGGAEVDHVLEARGGDVVAVETKASMAVSAHDFRHLADLRDRLGTRFRAGIVVYLGSQVLPFGPRLHALPLAGLAGQRE